jgi:hypothetical protein
VDAKALSRLSHRRPVTVFKTLFPLLYFGSCPSDEGCRHRLSGASGSSTNCASCLSRSSAGDGTAYADVGTVRVVFFRRFENLPAGEAEITAVQTTIARAARFPSRRGLFASAFRSSGYDRDRNEQEIQGQTLRLLHPGARRDGRPYLLARVLSGGRPRRFAPSPCLRFLQQREVQTGMRCCLLLGGTRKQSQI